MTEISPRLILSQPLTIADIQRIHDEGTISAYVAGTFSELVEGSYEDNMEWLRANVVGNETSQIFEPEILSYRLVGATPEKNTVIVCVKLDVNGILQAPDFKG